jgi:hypothetical protein
MIAAARNSFHELRAAQNPAYRLARYFIALDDRYGDL